MGKLRIDIITALPALLQGPLHHSIVGRAQKKEKVEIVIHDLRETTPLKHRQIDDYVYGGGAGMVLMPEPLACLIDHLMAQRAYDEVIFPTPDAPVFAQANANQLSLKGNLLFICGHYKGIDQRIRDTYVTLELSLGDYVLSGGELATAVMADAIIRLLPGVLGDETSALTDSFQDGLLSAPVYTRPANFRGQTVPDVLLSGHEARINQWRHEQALRVTQQRRPDVYQKYTKPDHK